jgi:Cellulase (glycosyl hydrolase family 5)
MRRAARTFLVVALVSGFAATPAQAFEIGLQDDGVFLNGEYDRTAAFDAARKLGVSYIRVDLIWNSYKRHGFAAYDNLVNDARARGIAVQITLMGNPRYLHGAPGLGYYKPKPTTFATFVRRAARHFKGRVLRWSIWNEPNITQFLAPVKTAPQQYGKLYKAGYKALKSVDRRNKVFIGELAAIPSVFEFMQKIGKGFKTDGFAYHPYQFYKGPLQRDTRFLGISNTPKIKSEVRKLARMRVVRSGGGGVPPIYFTELSYPIGKPYTTRESQRRLWIPQGFKLAKRMGIREVVYYKLFLRPFGANWNSGLLTMKGNPTPSFDTLVAARPSLIGH